MKALICILSLLCAQLSLAQETRRKVNNYGARGKETYHVLQSDENILHGKYERRTPSAITEGYYKNGEQDSLWKEYSLRDKKFLRVEGTFKDGLKDGLWTVWVSKNRLRYRGHYKEDRRVGKWKFYNTNGELEQEGEYDNGLRVGTWSFYDEDGYTEQEYNYSTKELVSDMSIDEYRKKKFKIINGNDTTFSLLERPPVYMSGLSKMRVARMKQLPMKKKSVDIDVSFVISGTGTMRDFRIVNPGETMLDNEAIRTVANLPEKWLPAMLNGQPISVEHTLTVSFKRVERNVYANPSFLRSNFIGNYYDYPTSYFGRSNYYGNYYTGAPYFSRIPPPMRLTYTEVQIR